MFVPGPNHEVFNWVELIGFIILVAGTLIYNEIVIVPWFGLDYNTKKMREARALDNPDSLEKGLKEDTDYVATSPGAPYDANRNARLLKRTQNNEASKNDDYEVEYDEPTK